MSGEMFDRRNIMLSDMDLTVITRMNLLNSCDRINVSNYRHRILSVISEKNKFLIY